MVCECSRSLSQLFCHNGTATTCGTLQEPASNVKGRLMYPRWNNIDFDFIIYLRGMWSAEGRLASVSPRCHLHITIQLDASLIHVVNLA